MSTWREQLPGDAQTRAAYDWLVANYHYPVVALLVVFGFWTRTVNWERFVSGDTVLYSGNDPFYHVRSVQYVVEHFPSTMPFDPWTNFPIGTSNSQFGTLFDQLIAVGALVVGLGNPSETQIRLVVLFAPAVFGVLTFVPAYYIGKRLGGRFGGVLSVAILAFSTGILYYQGWVGGSDHHIAEALFQAIAVLGIMVAITAAEAEKPVYELFADREFAALRRTIGWSVLAGVAVALYLWVWPPGVFLLGILGVFFVVYLSAEYLRGRSPEHVAIAGAIALSTVGVLTLSTTNTVEVRATARSLLQPGLAFGVAAGCLFMAWLARAWDDRDLPKLAYPGTVVGTGMVLLGLIAVLTPDVFGYLVNNVLRVIGLGYGTAETAATVGEVDPMSLSQLVTLDNVNYGFTAVVAVCGAALVLVRQVTRDEPRGQELLVFVWLAFVLLASLTQGRFEYYLMVPIAAMNALLAGAALRYVNRVETDGGVQSYQVLTVLTILFVVLAPITIFGPSAASVAPNKGPGSGIHGWQDSLDWMQDNTPVPGQFQNPDGEAMDYLGTFDRTEDFEYESGAYGVLSWWDYGHWITTQAHRIPNANPFQQGANHAARFLLAGNESAALDELADRDEADATTRFVMVDWQISQVMNKGSAPMAFVDDRSRSDFYGLIVSQQRLQETGNPYRSTLAVRHKQPYYDSMVNRLYNYHGSARNPEPIVLEWQGAVQTIPNGPTFSTARTGNDSQPQVISQFDTMQEAREYVAEAPSTRQIGGYGTVPTERVPALSHFRLVHVSESGAGPQHGFWRSINETSRTTSNWAKTFERVPGATIEGSGPANTNVTAGVTIEPPVGSPFEYTQRARTDENGEFTMTVPYATTGYDEWGLEEGYTNTSVRARGPYRISTGIESEDNTTFTNVGDVNVTEGQVLGEDDSPATVTLERTELGGGEADEDQAADESDGDDGGTTDGSETGDSANDTSQSLAPPATTTQGTAAVEP